MKENRWKKSKEGDPMATMNFQVVHFPESVNDLDLLKQDDSVRFLIIDPVLGYSSSKCFLNHRRAPEHVQLKIAELLKAYTFIPRYRKEAADAIKLLVRDYVDDETGRTMVMVDNYLQLYNLDSGFTFSECFDYPGDGKVGIKMIATKYLAKNVMLECHNFSTKCVSANDDPVNGWEFNEYSVTLSDKSSNRKSGRRESAWLGPSAIFNHSCEPNAEYHIDSDKNKVLIKIKRPIEVGGEILVNYGENFFENCCWCMVCIKKRQISDGESQTESDEAGRPKRKINRPNYNGSSGAKLIKADQKQAVLIFLKRFAKISFPEPIKMMETVFEDDLLRSGELKPLSDYFDSTSLTNEQEVEEWLEDIFSIMKLPIYENRLFEANVRVQSIIVSLMKKDFAQQGIDQNAALTKFESYQKRVAELSAAVRQFHVDNKQEEETNRALIREKDEKELAELDRRHLSRGHTTSNRQMRMEEDPEGRIEFSECFDWKHKFVIPSCPVMYRDYLGNDIHPDTPTYESECLFDPILYRNQCERNKQDESANPADNITTDGVSDDPLDVFRGLAHAGTSLAQLGSRRGRGRGRKRNAMSNDGLSRKRGAGRRKNLGRMQD